MSGIKTGRYTHEKKTKDILELKELEREECREQPCDLSRNSDASYYLNIAREVRKQSDEVLEEVHAVRDFRKISEKQNQFLRESMSVFNVQTGESLPGCEAYHSSAPQERPQHTDHQTEPVYIGFSQKEVNPDEKPLKVEGSARDVKVTWFRTIEFGIKCIVRFIKAIPGYRELHIDDQLNLIKREFNIIVKCFRFLLTFNS